MCSGEERAGRRGRRPGAALRQERVSRKFSQMILGRLIHFVTLSLKLEERRGDRSPSFIPLIISRYLHCLQAGRSAQSGTRLAAASHWPGRHRPDWNLESLWLCSAHSASLLGMQLSVSGGVICPLPHCCHPASDWGGHHSSTCMLY